MGPGSPCFIPMPLSPIGTMGAVDQYSRKRTGVWCSISISGPIVAFPRFFSLYGLYQSEIVNMKDVELG